MSENESTDPTPDLVKWFRRQAQANAADLPPAAYPEGGLPFATEPDVGRVEEACFVTKREEGEGPEKDRGDYWPLAVKDYEYAKARCPALVAAPPPMPVDCAVMSWEERQAYVATLEEALAAAVAIAADKTTSPPQPTTMPARVPLIERRNNEWFFRDEPMLEGFKPKLCKRAAHLLLCYRTAGTRFISDSALDRLAENAGVSKGHWKRVRDALLERFPDLFEKDDQQGFRLNPDTAWE
jgi:hypothetical protein